MKRNAYTLLEMIVVLAIISILFSLLLVGVQKARESANQLRCKNNLRQQSLAWASHAAAMGHFPLGSNANPKYLSPGQPLAVSEFKWTGGGWMWQILPFSDHESEYRQSNAASALDAVTTLLATPIPEYFCPSRARSRTFTARDDSPPFEPPYLSVRASNDYAASYGGKARGSGLFRESIDPKGWRKFLKVTELDITDGLSNTVFLAEWRIETGLYNGPNDVLRCGYANGGDSYFRSTISPGLSTPSAPKHDSFIKDNGKSARETGSAHAAGMYAAAGDGSVHFIAYTIDPKVWVLLCQRADGEMAAFPE